MSKLTNTSIIPALLFLCLLLFSCSSTPESKTMTDTKKETIASELTNTVKEPEIVSTETPNSISDEHFEPELDELLKKPTSENTDNEYSKEDSESPAEDISKELKTEAEEKLEDAKTALGKTEEIVTNADKTTEAVKNKVEEVTKTVAVPFSHSKFNTLLKKNVSYTGKVNYNGFKGNASFEEYLKEVSANKPQANWSRNRKLAYWINAYNAFTIKLIIDNYPLKSIMDLHGGKPWDHKFIKIGSNTYSLNHIEHKIIRPVFKEPRIHFACVCAAKSCPKLANIAYTSSNLNSLLNTQTKYFINNKSKNEIADKTLKVSQLFNWYASDFGDVNAYIAKYSNSAFKPDKDIEFMTYDWSLNN